MRTKPINPYDKLLRDSRDLGRQVTHPRAVVMCKAARQSMKGMYNRVSAADAIGWDVRIRAVGDELLVEYVERPKIPARFVQ